MALRSPFGVFWGEIYGSLWMLIEQGLPRKCGCLEGAGSDMIPIAQYE